MNDRKSDIISKLNRDLSDTVTFFKELNDEQLQQQVYDHGARWNSKLVLAHLVTIERSMHTLFQNILTGGSGAPDDFDLERFNRSQPQKLIHLPINDLIGLFKQVRDQTITIVERMEDEDLDRKGYHPYHGEGQLERFIRWAYEHSLHHRQVIEEKIDD